MPLYEYRCQTCRQSFDILETGDAPDSPYCVHCQGTQTSRTFARFAVAGRGDLRESTFHGCHDGHHHPADHDHGHDHDHDSGSETETGSGLPEP